MTRFKEKCSYTPDRKSHLTLVVVRGEREAVWPYVVATVFMLVLIAVFGVFL